jgi:hypothetical protein
MVWLEAKEYLEGHSFCFLLSFIGVVDIMYLLEEIHSSPFKGPPRLLSKKRDVKVSLKRNLQGAIIRRD